MGGSTSSYYSSITGSSSSNTYTSNYSVINPAVIVLIVLGSVVGIGLLVLVVVINCKLFIRSRDQSRQRYHMNKYGPPQHTNNSQQQMTRSEIHPSSKIPSYYQRPLQSELSELP